MVNDEIETVRINALNSLRKISDKIQLKETQLHIVLSALDDTESSVRIAVRNLLKVTTMINITCLHASIHALLNNLHRYPFDCDTIFSCLKALGERHASFIGRFSIYRKVVVLEIND